MRLYYGVKPHHVRRQKFSRDFFSTRCIHTVANPPTVGSKSSLPPQGEDPNCDPNNPIRLDYSRTSIAHHKIKSGIIRTDCRYSRHLSRLTGNDIFLKMEINQVTGSFKERGARFALMNLPDEQKKKGVYAASAGNHALALSYHGKELGVPVNVVMPRYAPIMKISKCRELGANIMIEGENISESRLIALREMREKGGQYINGYDHIDILAGAGTVGLEIIDQLPSVDTVLVPVGGGGLIAGVAVAVKALSPHTEIIGVLPERCPSLISSLEAGHPVPVECKSTLADGLAVPYVGVNAFHTLKDLVDTVVTVKEKDISVAVLRLIEFEKVVPEGAGAITTAALLSGQLDHLKGKKIVSILSGGNIDSSALGRSIERGMAFDERLVRFNVVVSDRPGGLAELAEAVAAVGANIKDIFTERAFLRQDIYSVRVKIIVETRGTEHTEEVHQKLKECFKFVELNRYRLQLCEGVEKKWNRK